jgi:hypothetical protein
MFINYHMECFFVGNKHLKNSNITALFSVGACALPPFNVGHRMESFTQLYNQTIYYITSLI